MPVTATAYTYDELSEDAKKTAVEKSRYCCVEYWDWWDYIYEWYITEILPEQGFHVPETKNGNGKKTGHAMYFSGFSSQGDGACFEADVNIRQFLRANKLSNEFRSLYYWSDPEFGYADANIYQSGHYYHRHTMYSEHEWSGDWDENADNSPARSQLEELESIILSEAKDLALKLYRSLEEEYDAMTKDDYVADHILANEYLFWSNGEPAHFA